MKKIILPLILLIIAFNARADRNTIDIKNNKWYLCQNLSISTSDFKSCESNLTVFKVSKSFKHRKDSQAICTLIDLSNTKKGKLIFSIENGNNFFNVWIDGKKAVNKLENENIVCEYDYPAENEEILLTLEIKPEIKIDEETLNAFLQNAKLTSISGIYISRAIPSKDKYFGCPMLEILVSNFLDEDVDGKLYARIFTLENHELIAENNNCAFSRSGSESTIDVIFPEIKTAFIGKYSVEIELVDKEKNEEVIDRLLVPVEFK